AGRDGAAARPGLEHGHHLRAVGPRLHVPGGDPRLVQPVRDRLAAVEHAGRFLLPGHAGRGVEQGPARRVEHEPRGAANGRGGAGAWTGRLEAAGGQVSTDGKGRCLDNVFVERLWRTVKYEDISLRGYERVPELQAGLGRYFPY